MKDKNVFIGKHHLLFRWFEMTKNEFREVPGAIETDTGMRKLYGYMKSHRYHIYVPTTIFEPKVAIIRAYKVEDGQEPDRPETVLATTSVPLGSMPIWNVEYQAIQKSRRDKQKIRKTMESLEEKLEPEEL